MSSDAEPEPVPHQARTPAHTTQMVPDSTSPPHTIGVLGGGQLGQMLAQAASPLGIHVICYDPAPDACAGQTTRLIQAPWDDHDALHNFASLVDLFTWEFENVPTATIELLAAIKPVHPTLAALRTGQNRSLEKSLALELGADVHAFASVHSQAALEAAVASIGIPCIVKTLNGGYDGKGQYLIRTSHDVSNAWQALGGQPSIVEQFVPFESELSVIGVRGHNGDIRTYPPIANVHQDGVLRSSRPILPGDAKAPPAAALARAEHFVRRLLAHLNYVGVLAVEFFVRGERVLFNEMAPRVHNSGHWTIEGAITSQFENHIRAVCGLPLGPCECINNQPSLMLNILSQPVETAALAAIPGAHIHHYGKEPREGRKLGHVTLFPIPSDYLTQPALVPLLPSPSQKQTLSL